MDRTAGKDSRWNNYCIKIIHRIRDDGDDFPLEEEINKLVNYTINTFVDSPSYQDATSRVSRIKRLWESQNRKRNKRERQQQEGEPMNLDAKLEQVLGESGETELATKVELSKSATDAIQGILAKIASNNDIAFADKVIIRLSKEDGIITFKGAESIEKTAKELTTEHREELPSSDFVFPKEKRYPINDKSHAQNALARIEQHGTPEEKEKVRRKVKQKYPDMEVSEK